MFDIDVQFPDSDNCSVVIQKIPLLLGYIHWSIYTEREEEWASKRGKMLKNSES